MSTDYSTKEKISFADLFDGRLERYGVREHISEDSTENRRCLTDGRNYLWVFAADDRTLEILKRYGGCGAAMSDFPGGGNAPGQILGAIAKAFDTDISSFAYSAVFLCETFCLVVCSFCLGGFLAA